MQTAIDTRKVTGRRRLRFESLDAVLADAEQLTRADRAGNLKRLGNWSLGTTLGHLAGWMNFAFDGTPLNPPWFVRILLRLGKRRYLRETLRPGVRLSGVPAGTLCTDELSTDEGLSRLRAAVERFGGGAPLRPDSFFGPLTRDEHIALHCRHAELHLGFFIPGS